MNMAAVGGYFRGLRKERGYSVARVAAELEKVLHRNVSTATISRLENAANETNGIDLVTAMAQVLDGHILDVMILFSKASITAEEGEEIGRKAARGEYAYLTPELAEQLLTLNGAAREATLARLRQMLQEM